MDSYRQRDRNARTLGVIIVIAPGSLSLVCLVTFHFFFHLLQKWLNKHKKKEYFDCVNSKGKTFSAETLFLILILEQQKMINEMIAALRHTGIV